MPADWDVLLASDVVYEAQPRALLEAGARRGRSVLVSEPHRPGLEHWPEAPIASYEARAVPDVDSPTCRASIYRLATSA